jgi:hypothetical protein
LSCQVLRWSFLALRGDFHLDLAMTEEPHKMQIKTEMLQVGGAAAAGAAAAAATWRWHNYRTGRAVKAQCVGAAGLLWRSRQLRVCRGYAPPICLLKDPRTQQALQNAPDALSVVVFLLCVPVVCCRAVLHPQGSMMRRFSSYVGVQRLGPNQCRLEMSLLMQPNIYVPFGVRHMIGGQVRRRACAVKEQACFCKAGCACL